MSSEKSQQHSIMPGILPGSANQCILGNLCYILSRKCIAQCTLAVQHAFTNEDAIRQCVHLQSCVLDLWFWVACRCRFLCGCNLLYHRMGYSIRILNQGTCPIHSESSNQSSGHMNTTTIHAPYLHSPHVKPCAYLLQLYSLTVFS